MNQPYSFQGKQSLRLASILLLFISSIFAPSSRAQSRTNRASAPRPSTRSITVRTEPNAFVWIDGIRRGETDTAGSLIIKNISAGRYIMRVRAIGFKETSVTLSPAQRGAVSVRLVKTTDQAELLFQQAEELREKARDELGHRAAERLYREAIKVCHRFPEAHLGLARVMLELNDYVAALAEIDSAHAMRSNYAEASAVEGRILRMAADGAAAIEAFERSIEEAKGFQPEAHTGLALIYQDKGQYEQAALEFTKALAQLSDTEPILYQLLGAVYEKLEKYKEAVAAYEKYLELAPDGSLAPALRSVMDQLRKQAEGASGLPF